jgi:MFS family permease
MDTPSSGPSLLATLRDVTFRSLRHRNYRLYFYGQIVSFTGSWMQSAALLWLVYDATADALWPALMIVAQLGPTLLLGPVGGSLADRFSRRKVIVCTQLLFLVNALLLTLVVATNCASPWLLFTLALANGAIQAIDLPARLAYVPDLIPRVDLINAVSLNSLLFNTARAIGPALAGGLFLLAGWLVPFLPETRPVILGSIGCFLLNAMSYLAMLAALRRIDATESDHQSKPTGSPLEGFRYILARPVLAALLVCTGLVSVFGWPTLVLFPPYTRLVLQHAEKEYSLLVSALGLGALLAALANATYGTPARTRVFVILGSSLTALGILGLALGNTMPGALLSSAVFGFGMILYLSTGQSVLQLNTPNEARGRVMVLWPMTLSGSTLLGNLVFGWAAREYPIPDLLAVMAGGVGLTALVILGLVVALRR